MIRTNRREFIKATSASVAVCTASPVATVLGDDDSGLFSLERTVAHGGFDGKMCWVHARAGAIPAGQLGNGSDNPLIVMTMQKLLLSGSDVFYALHETRSADLGESWTAPEAHESFARQKVDSTTSGELPTGATVAPRLLQDGDETTVCDFVPMWHAASQRLLGLGQTVWYRNNRVMHVRPRGIAYAVYDASSNRWSSWSTVNLPHERRFQNAGSGSVQRVDLIGGDVLIPFYFKEPTRQQYSVSVSRCRFDGHMLDYVEHGNELTVPVQRGLYEPSLTKFRGKYYLTMRNDEHSYVSVSHDGLHFEPPRRWTFDDASDLGSYNTQQHWVTHSDAVFLVYTRRGANNDHVFRHRAPLFIARVDLDKLQVVRMTEQILVPDRGARLGNFGVVDVSPSETWVTVTEWMQPAGVEKRGSDNRVFVAKLKWKRPNQLVSYASNAAPKTDVMPPWERIKPYFSPPQSWKGKLGKYTSPLDFADGTRVETPADWKRRRAEILTEWTSLLGEWPPLITKPEAEMLESQRRENFTQHRIRFRWTPRESTTGYLLVPDGASSRPAVITVYYEPETAIGLGTPNRDFTFQLARRGFVSLSIGTTEATAAKTYGLYHPSIEDAEIQPLSMLAYAAANAWYVLADRPEVDSARIGIVGHSFGGKWAMFASCLFDKFACAAWSDPGIVFDESRPNVNYWEPWYLGYHPKPWRERGVITPDNPARGLYPKLAANGHDLHELHALMPPRPFLVSGGAEDPPRRWEALNHAVAVNRVLGRTNRVAMTNRPDHAPNDDSNEVIYSFFEHFDDTGHLYFGLGENLGSSYSLVGPDGTRFHGGGEGGNVYRCRVDGTNLEHVATGFWNPFGMCVDKLGRVYAVGNDPDASPPCRLVHVVDGGDYGFQFRYGRSGKHPLQAWDGELPGTLPMMAGTSEAPSGVLLWHGQLYSSSWGEYRLERFTLKPKGASLSADREVIVQGDDQFRPVDLAISPDGSLYFTDWVDRSYNVHGKGRIWRLSWKEAPEGSAPLFQQPEERAIPALNAEAIRAAAATQNVDWDALTSTDPFLRHAAMMGLKGSALLTVDEFSVRRHPGQRLGILEAARRSKLSSGVRSQLIQRALEDNDSSVRLYAVRWIADEQLREFRGALDGLMNNTDSSVALFKAILATIEWLDLGEDGQPASLNGGRVAGESLLLAAFRDDTRPALQSMALKSLPADHPVMNPENLAELIRNPHRPSSVRREAARSLAISEMSAAQVTREAIVAETEIPAEVRADVLAGIESKTEDVAEPHPNVTEIDAWLEILKGQGDADAGWRVFFGRGQARCASCHRLDGRGADVGPDLTGIGQRMDRRRLLQSILQPSREVGPRYVPWLLQTGDGRSWLGMSLGIFDNGRVERFLAADGKQFEISLREVESRRLSENSIMPDGLHQLLTIEDLRNLLAILSIL